MASALLSKAFLYLDFIAHHQGLILDNVGEVNALLFFFY